MAFNIRSEAVCWLGVVICDSMLFWELNVVVEDQDSTSNCLDLT